MDAGERIGIVGAGAWGLSAALALAEAGRTDVHVWERSHPGSGNTSRAAGLVSTHLREETDIRWVLETRRRLEALRAWGTDRDLPAAAHTFHAAGNLTLAARNNQFRLEQLRGRIARAGGHAELLPGSELARPEWKLKSTQHAVGLWSAEDGYVEAGDVVSLLHAKIRDLGVHVHSDRAASVDIEQGQARGVRTPEGRTPCGHVVVAAGAWSKALLAPAGLALPLKPYRTQLAQVEYAHEGKVPILHDTEQGVYARADGANRILVGDGTEHVESDPDTFNAGTDHAFVEKVAKTVSRRFRDGDAARYRTGWAGLCVATPDRNPIIGPDPRVRGLHLMTGDNGFGLMRCLALGALLAARLGGKMVPGAQTCSPKRFPLEQADFTIREGFEL